MVLSWKICIRNSQNAIYHKDILMPFYFINISFFIGQVLGAVFAGAVKSFIAAPDGRVADIAILGNGLSKPLIGHASLPPTASLASPNKYG